MLCLRWWLSVWVRKKTRACRLERTGSGGFLEMELTCSWGGEQWPRLGRDSRQKHDICKDQRRDPLQSTWAATDDCHRPGGIEIKAPTSPESVDQAHGPFFFTVLTWQRRQGSEFPGVSLLETPPLWLAKVPHPDSLWRIDFNTGIVIRRKW